MSGRVTVLDLSGLDRYAALDRTNNMLADPGIRDLSELLIVDTAGEAGAHRAALEALLSAHRVERYLCVLVGGGSVAGDGDGAVPDEAVLRLPRQLEGVTLWLPHDHGVDWPYRAAAPAKNREPGESGLHRLVELLQQPEVFRRTAELLARVPYGAACPALGLAEGDEIRHEDQQWALRAALERLLASSDAPLAPPSDAAESHQGSVASIGFTAGSRLDHAREDARRSVAEAQQAAQSITGEFSLFKGHTPVLGCLSDGADRLADLRTELLVLATGVQTSERPRDLLSEKGVVLPAVERSPKEIRRVLEQSTHAWLKDDASLPQIGSSLRARANALGENVDHRAAFQRALSPDLLDALSAPAPFPAPQRSLPLVGAAVSAAASAAFGLIGGGLVALAWTALVVWGVVRAPNRAGLHPVSLLLNAVAALAAGLGAGAAAPELPLPLTAVCALGPLAALVVLLRCWRNRARRWVHLLPLEEAAHAADEASVLLERAAADWALLESRADDRDSMSRYQSAVGGVQQALARRLVELGRETRGHPPRLRQEYLDTVRGQAVDLVKTALQPSLDSLNRYDLATHARDAEHGAEELLRTWRHHVSRYGPVEPPPFATERADGASPVADEQLAELVQAAAADPLQEMWQLCAPADLALLDVMGGPPPVVRFAPATGRTHFRRRLPSDVLWISVSRAGILRLAPLQAGTVRWSWGGEPGENGAEA